jgi:hypothetical protein
MTKFIRAVSTILFCGFLSACGGGGGSAGVASNSVDLFTNAPSKLVLTTGETRTFQIGGGTPNFIAYSSSPNIVVSVKERALTITALQPVPLANIEIVDSFARRMTLDLAAYNSFVNSTMDLTGAAGDPVKFIVTGGNGPYIVTVADQSIATVTSTSGTSAGYIVTTQLLMQGSTDVSVVDASGWTTKTKITALAASTQLRTSPSKLTISENTLGIVPLQIYGGTAPFTATTSDTVLSSVVVTGSTLNIGLGSQGNRCVTVRDAAGAVQIGGLYPITLTLTDSTGATATTTVNIKENGTCP